MSVQKHVSKMSPLLTKARNMSDHCAADTNSGAAFKYGSSGAKTVRPNTCHAASGDCEVSCKAQRTPSTELDMAAQHRRYQASSGRTWISAMKGPARTQQKPCLEVSVLSPIHG